MQVKLETNKIRMKNFSAVTQELHPSVNYCSIKGFVVELEQFVCLQFYLYTSVINNKVRENADKFLNALGNQPSNKVYEFKFKDEKVHIKQGTDPVTINVLVDIKEVKTDIAQ